MIVRVERFPLVVGFLTIPPAIFFLCALVADILNRGPLSIDVPAGGQLL